jgi:hypothetical protein
MVHHYEKNKGEPANIHLPIRYSTECHQLHFETAADQTEGLHVLCQQIWMRGWE